MRRGWVASMVIVAMLAGCVENGQESTESSILDASLIDDPLLVECEEALLVARGEVSEGLPDITPDNAVGVVLEALTTACGIDLFNGVSTTEAELLSQILESLSTKVSSPAPQLAQPLTGISPGSSPPGFVFDLPVDPLPTEYVFYISNDMFDAADEAAEEVILTAASYIDAATEIVGCSLPGSGPGSIDLYVLGIHLRSEVAAGQWEPVANGDTLVSGDGVAVGGEQTNTGGVIRIANLVPIPTLGPSAEATCVASTTTTATTTCIWLVIWWRCTTTIESDVTLTPHGARASQNALGIPGLVDAVHEYRHAGDAVGAVNCRPLDKVSVHHDPSFAFPASSGFVIC